MRHKRPVLGRSRLVLGCRRRHAGYSGPGPSFARACSVQAPTCHLPGCARAGSKVDPTGGPARPGTRGRRFAPIKRCRPSKCQGRTRRWPGLWGAGLIRRASRRSWAGNPWLHWGEFPPRHRLEGGARPNSGPPWSCAPRYQDREPPESFRRRVGPLRAVRSGRGGRGYRSRIYPSPEANPER